MLRELLTVCFASAVAIAANGITVSKAIDLSGQWNVQGENLSGKVLLPGTLADAGLGVKQTSAHFSQYRERTSKTALARKYKYHGKAVYSRTVTLSEEDVEKPLEFFLERVMWTSRLKIDGRGSMSCQVF